MISKIEITLTETDQARLDHLTAALERVAAAYEAVTTGSVLIDSPAEAPSEPTAAPEPEAAKEPAPEPKKATKASKTPPAATVTAEDLRAQVVRLCASGKKDDVRAIVQQYGPKVSDIPEDKLAEVSARLAKLEG